MIFIINCIDFTHVILADVKKRDLCYFEFSIENGIQARDSAKEINDVERPDCVNERTAPNWKFILVLKTNQLVGGLLF